MGANTDQSGSPPSLSSIPGGYRSGSDSSSPSRRYDPRHDPFALPRAVRARKAEYTHEQLLSVKVGTWNVAAIQGTEEDIGKWFVERKGICEQLSGLRIEDLHDQPDGVDHDSGDSSKSAQGRRFKHKGFLKMPPYAPEKVGLYVLGLQEIVDVSSPAETLRPYVDPSPANRWKTALEKALPDGFQLVAETQLVGLLLLVYAAPFVVGSISSVSSSSVGTGLLGYMGNKGAVSTRLMIGETTCLVFVNCHLSAGADKNSLERRNWDAAQITTRTRFDPIDPEKGLRVDPTDSIGREDFAFWLGDLNYRLEDIQGDDVRQVLARHAENEYDKKHVMAREVKDIPSSARSIVDQDKKVEEPLPTLSDEEVDPHTDPTSLQTTLSSLLPHDQLRVQQERKKAFYDGWREGDISFLPTYKYDVGSVARFDSSEKHRGPSWCDRILYRTRHDIVSHERLTREAEKARKRDEEMKARGLDKAASDDSVLFDYNPDVDGADSGDEYDPSKDRSSDSASVSSQDDLDDSIRLEYYVSHQGILSSDHKPLAAGFTIKYESVDPHLKAKVHQEVVRELDKAENESRPGLTVVVDTYGEDPQKSTRDPNTVDFGEVPFDVPITRSLTIANTSGVPATFRFEKPDRHDGYHHKTPSWLEFRVAVPSHQDEDKKRKAGERTLFPGELANIDITAHVRDIEHAHLLNDGIIQLEDILVLRVTSGRDHFISAYGRWLPTCFGRSVEDLTRMPEAGARSLLNTGPPSNEQDQKAPRLSAPRELFRLTEAISELSERAIAEWGMTKGGSEEESPPWAKDNGAGWPFDPETWTLKDKERRLPLLASVREALDTNQDLGSIFAPEMTALQRLELLSETLLVFLRSLSDGIVTGPIWEKMDHQIIAREKNKSPPLSWDETQAWVLENLAYSPAHSVSFTFVTFMLAHIANEIAPSPSTAPALPELSEQESHVKKRDSIQTLSRQSTTPANMSASASIGSIQRLPRILTASSLADLQANVAHRRQAVETALASIFASVLISSETVPNKDKERRAMEERKRSIIEPFLKTVEVDNLGPSGGAP